MAEPIYRRVVIKLSGEYFAGPHASGMDQPTIDRVAGDLIEARQLGIEIASSSAAAIWSAAWKYRRAESPGRPAIPWECSPP